MLSIYKYRQNSLPPGLFTAVDGGRVRQKMAVFDTWSRAQNYFFKIKKGGQYPTYSL